MRYDKLIVNVIKFVSYCDVLRHVFKKVFFFFFEIKGNVVQENVILKGLMFQTGPVDTVWEVSDGPRDRYYITFGFLGKRRTPNGQKVGTRHELIYYVFRSHLSNNYSSISDVGHSFLCFRTLSSVRFRLNYFPTFGRHHTFYTRSQSFNSHNSRGSKTVIIIYRRPYNSHTRAQSVKAHKLYTANNKISYVHLG